MLTVPLIQKNVVVKYGVKIRNTSRARNKEYNWVFCGKEIVSESLCPNINYEGSKGEVWEEKKGRIYRVLNLESSDQDYLRTADKKGHHFQRHGTSWWPRLVKNVCSSLMDEWGETKQPKNYWSLPHIVSFCILRPTIADHRWVAASLHNLKTVRRLNYEIVKHKDGAKLL